MNNKINPNIIRQGLFLVFLLFLGIIILKEMYFMLGAFLGAITLYVLMRPAMLKLIINRKWKKWIAALFMMLISVILLIIPFGWLTTYAIKTIRPLIQNPEVINHTFLQINDYLIQNLSLDILSAKNLSNINSSILSFAQKTIEETMSGVGNIMLMYVILYFMLIETTSIEKWLRHNIPFKNQNVQTSISEFRSLVYSNAIGIPLVAVAQGTVGLLGYWIFGVDQFILMGLLTAISSVVPIVGSMLIFLPVMIYELSQGRIWQGVGVGLWGIFLIGSVDNIARLMIQKKLANIHPLITLFGAFIGINMFGFLGIIFGPLLISMFFVLIKIYINEFGVADADEVEKEAKKEQTEANLAAENPAQ